MLKQLIFPDFVEIRFSRSQGSFDALQLSVIIQGVPIKNDCTQYYAISSITTENSRANFYSSILTPNIHTMQFCSCILTLQILFTSVIIGGHNFITELLAPRHQKMLVQKHM